METAVNLSPEQRHALEQGEAVPVTVEQTECVLLRRDIYERVKKVVQCDDSEFDPREAYPLVNEVMREDDEQDPLLDSYQKYRP